MDHGVSSRTRTRIGRDEPKSHGPLSTYLLEWWIYRTTQRFCSHKLAIALHESPRVGSTRQPATPIHPTSIFANLVFIQITSLNLYILRSYIYMELKCNLELS